MRFLLTIFAMLFLLAACNSGADNADNKRPEEKSHDVSTNYFRISQPTLVDTLHLGDSLSFRIEARQENVEIDSIRIEAQGRNLGVFTQLAFNVKMDVQTVGLNDVHVTAVLNNGRKQSKRIRVFLLSDQPAAQLKYELVNTYKHNPEHYTQGLEIHDGFLYEGTGNYGVSGLYKKELRSPAEMKSVDLPANRFGEGITILGSRLYQLTYRSREAYVYDLNSFNLMQKFTYPVNVQGWGLTHKDDQLIMSTGEAILYFLEPNRFNQLGQLWVCDEKGPVYSLNELECIGDKVYSNIYLDNRIAKIDLNTGKIEAYLDLSPLVPAAFKQDHDNVLNGIAYNAETNTFFVTGKRWPVLYEIRIME